MRFLDIILFIIILFLCVLIDYRVDGIEKNDKKQDSLFNDMYYSVIDTFEKEAFLVTLTTYNPSKAQTDKSPNLTACNLKINTKNPYSQRYVGLSRDLLEEFRYGEIVELQNAGSYNGFYIVADCMNKRFLRYVDVLIGSKQKHIKMENVVLKHANNDD
jgi:3D (Asp-Asp-Asp) domain-containing protein